MGKKHCYYDCPGTKKKRKKKKGVWEKIENFKEKGSFRKNLKEKTKSAKSFKLLFVLTVFFFSFPFFSPGCRSTRYLALFPLSSSPFFASPLFFYSSPRFS